MVKSCVVVVVGGGGLLDYTVSYLGKPRSLTIVYLSLKALFKKGVDSVNNQVNFYIEKIISKEHS